MNKIFLPKDLEVVDTKSQELDVPEDAILINVLDASGSMNGSKIENCLAAINDDPLIDRYRTIVFSNSIDIMHGKAEVRIPMGLTRLNDAIGLAIKEASKEYKKGQYVLIRIYTDGKENNSTQYYTEKIRQMIDKVKDKYIITFIGTANDVQNAINTYGIEESNTLVLESNDGEGFNKALATTREATVRTYTMMSKGIAASTLTTNFYKN